MGHSLALRADRSPHKGYRSRHPPLDRPIHPRFTPDQMPEPSNRGADRTTVLCPVGRVGSVLQDR